VLAKSGKKPKVEGVIEKMVIKDEARSLELHHVMNLDHSDGMLSPISRRNGCCSRLTLPSPRRDSP